MTQVKIRQELGDDGTSSGVEAEQIQDDQLIAKPFDPDRIDVQTRPMVVQLLKSRLESGAINLAPDFQRKAGVWDNKRQSRLIESLLLRIPLPSFYVSENQAEEWEVVDGIQRLTAIMRFIDPSLLGQDYQQLCLEGLEYLGERFNGATFDDLDPRLKRRILETEFTFHVIKHSTPEEVRFNIFARINTGGMPLTHQELRHALVPGQAREILKIWAESDAFQDAIDRSVRGHRMADREMVLRYIAFRMESAEKYSYTDLNQFLVSAMKRINKLSSVEVDQAFQEFCQAMNTAREIFGTDAFRKRFEATATRNPINKALFEAVAVGLAEMSVHSQMRLIERADMVRSEFIKLMNNAEFHAAVSVSTGDPNKVKLRFKSVTDLFEAVSSQ